MSDIVYYDWRQNLNRKKLESFNKELQKWFKKREITSVEWDDLGES